MNIFWDNWFFIYGQRRVQIRLRAAVTDPVFTSEPVAQKRFRLLIVSQKNLFVDVIRFEDTLSRKIGNHTV